jgi:hypothetical protein
VPRGIPPGERAIYQQLIALDHEASIARFGR